MSCVADPIAPAPECPNRFFKVAADNDVLRLQVCRAAEAAQGKISTCDLLLERPIHIVVTTDPGGGIPLCLGAYHCRNDVIELLDPALLRKTIGETDPLSLVPEEDLIVSLLVHEMAHAWVSRSDLAQNVSRLEDEYIAYALQIDSLSDTVRTQVLAASRLDGPVSLEDLTAWRLFTNPSGFGLLSWLHFKSPGNGCGVVNSFLNGSLNLPDDEIFFYP